MGNLGKQSALLTVIALIGINALAADCEPTWESLQTVAIPEWVKDAKFGIYTHWGPYSVPGYKGNTYIAEMYTTPEKDKEGYRKFHEEQFGPIETFGYKEIVDQFTAPKFDAKEWVDVMESGGVKFAGLCLAHHDGFALWDSEYTTWDSMDRGPKRDLYGEIAKEVRKRDDMKLLATFHHARSYGFSQKSAKNAGFTDEEKAKLDIFDPKYADIYFNPDYMTKEQFGLEWQNKVNEVMRKYQPDMFWFDGLSGSIVSGVINEDALLNCFADYYNNGTPYVEQTVIANKLPGTTLWNFPVGFGLRCYENGRDMERDVRGDWLIDRAIGYPWTWVRNKTYKQKASYHIVSIVDISARGGVMLLSLTPKGDGSIPDEEKKIMAGIGAWLRVNGEGIYSTRPWKVVEEGVTGDELRVVRENRKKPGVIQAKWGFDQLEQSKGQAFRFTRSKDYSSLYVHVVGVPESGAVTIQTLRTGNVAKNGAGIASVSMLGSDEKIDWKQTDEGLMLVFPEVLPCEVSYTFKVTPKAGKIDDAPREKLDDPIKRKGDWPVFKGSPLG
ncbi:alpha-L-fucosidase [Pontiella sulfatireligans]|uniref:alpha-L-fucosidase n=1 Tax=Pontiella sulfatireligans TaxID=2750658 RepID=A0A6C2UHC7_9BACT|nr:alpha-L-fucosidase [Pontiella sulfatireligans]VGO19339.1 hypothetical protein SCARR_01397 [Pontiella sulfatireligans]